MTRILPLVCLLLSASAPAEPLLVFAAVSTSEPLREAGRRFEAETGQAVSFSFGASGDLARQVEAGAPADVFLSADERRMNQLVQAGRVKRENVVSLLSNQLVVVVGKDSPLQIKDAAALAGVETLALADPQTVPAGGYAREWLEKQQVWPAVKDRFVPTLNVRAALAAVETGRADAAIVYRTDARSSSRVRVAYVPPASEQPLIRYPVAPVKASQPARDFVAFLQSPAVRAIFERAGFESVK